MVNAQDERKVTRKGMDIMVLTLWLGRRGAGLSVGPNI